MSTQTADRTQLESFATESEIEESMEDSIAQKKPGSHKSNKTARNLVVLGLAVAAGVAAWQWHGSTSAHPAAAEAPSVAVSVPLQRELDARLGFLGQFAAVENVEIRAQVGGTLTQIHFKDGDLVHKGDLLFTIDPTPFEIKLSQANAQLENAVARLELADQQLVRARMLKKSEAGTTENVDQRASDQKAAEAAVNEAKALV